MQIYTISSINKDIFKLYTKYNELGKIKSMILHVLGVIDVLKPKQYQRIKDNYRYVRTRQNNVKINWVIKIHPSNVTIYWEPDRLIQ